MMMLNRLATLSLALMVTVPAGCADDPCKDEAPAFQVRLRLGSGVEAAKVKILRAEIRAAGLQIKHSFSINGELADGETSFDVNVGSAGSAGFTAEVQLILQDATGKELARAQKKLTASGDACNVLSIKAGFLPDGGVPDGGKLLDPASGFCSTDRWCWVSPLPQGNHLHAIWGTSATDLYAAGDNETLIHFTGKGAHGGWTRVVTRTALEAAHPLNGIWGSGPSDVFVVGGDRALLVLHFDGKGWTRRFLPPEPGSSLRAVWGTGPTDVYAVGAPSCKVFHRRQDHKWREANVPKCTEALTDVLGWGSDVLAVGEKSRLVYRQNDTWSKGVTGIKTDTRLTGIWGSGPSDLTLVGGPFALYRALTYPSSWTPSTTSGTDDLEDVWGSGPTEVYAAGGSGALSKSSSGALYRHDGTTLTALNIPRSGYLRHIWGFGASSVFVVGDGGAILHGAGSAFLHLRNPITFSYLRGVWGADPSNVFVVGAGGTVARYDGAVWATEEGVSTSSDLQAVWGSGPTNVYAAGDSGVVIRFDGAAWSQLSLSSQWTAWQISTPPALRGIWGSGPSSVFFAGDGGIIVHHDGNAWSLSRKGSSTSPALRAIWGTGPSDVYAAGDKGTVIHYDGASWSEPPLVISWTVLKVNTPPSLRGIWGSSPSSVLFVGEQGTVLHLGTDGSITKWTLMTSGTTRQLVSVWGTSPTDILALGAEGEIIRYSRQSASTDPAWKAMTTGTDLDLWGLWGSGSSDIWVVGDHGAVLHRTGQ